MQAKGAGSFSVILNSSNWWLVGDDTEVEWSGPGYAADQGIADWPNDLSTDTLAAGGRTLVPNRQYRCWQNGAISKITYSVAQVGTGNPAIQFGLTRFNQADSDWDVIATSSSFVPAGTGTFTLTLSPAWNVQVGDWIAVWLFGSATDGQKCKLSAASPDGFGIANNVLGNASTTFPSGYTVSADYALVGLRPKLALVGDSWCGEGISGEEYATYGEGGRSHNASDANHWSGDFTSWVNYWMEEYQAGLTTVNFSKGGDALTADVSTNMPAALRRKPDIVILHNSNSAAGDVRAGGWDQLDALQVLLNANTPVPDLFVVDMPPTLNSPDFRRWAYVHLPDWCAQNGAKLIRIWAAMRDGAAMAAAYRHADYPTDTAHCNYVGAQFQATTFLDSLEAYYNQGDKGFVYSYTAGSIAAGTAIVHTADCVIAFDCNTPTSGNIDIDFRVQSATNKWTLRIASDGAMTLIETVAGSASDRDTAAAGAVVDGNRVEIAMVDTEIYVFVEGVVSSVNISNAANFKTATAGEVDVIGTGGSVSKLVVFEYEWTALA